MKEKSHLVALTVFHVLTSCVDPEMDYSLGCVLGLNPQNEMSKQVAVTFYLSQNLYF